MLIAGFAVLVGVLGWRSRGWPLVHDAPIMHYAAWRIANGAVPYRDLFDMNFPGTYLLHLAVVRGLGAGDLAWRVFDLGWLALTSLAVAAWAAPWGAAAAVGGALLFAAHHLAGGPWQAGQRDFLLCLFLLVGALGVARWLERRRGVGDLVAGGLALGAGITVKPHALAFAAALGVVVAVAAWRAEPGAARVSPGARRVWPLAALVAGVVVAPLAVVGWLGVAGGLSAWRTIVADYLLPLYARLGRPAGWGFHRWQVWIPIAVAVLASLGSAACHRRLGVRHAMAAVGLAYGVGHYVGQGKGWEYHVYPLAAFAGVLAFSELPRLRRGLAWSLPLAASLAASLVLLAAKGVEAGGAEWIGAKVRRVDAVVRELGPRLRPGDLVQVLDTTEGGLHALLRLGTIQPTRFLYDFHFFHDAGDPVIAGLRTEFVRALEARAPRFIVLFERSWPAGGYERIDTFPALSARLREHFRLAARGDGYLLYARRDGS